MSQLIKQGYYIRTYDRDIFITEEQKVSLYHAMDSGVAYFGINGGRIMMSQIKEIVQSSDYEKSIAGSYHCPRHPDNIVPKGKTCGYC